MDFEFMLQAFPSILKGLPMTLFLTVVSMLLGTVIGFVVAICRVFRVPVLRQIAAVYISFIRGTPMIVQIYLVYFGIPTLLSAANAYFNLSLNVYDVYPVTYAILAFSVNMGAYLSESIRAALESVGKGQMEAGHSVGMTTMQTMRSIILPQAAVVAFPTFANHFLELLKGTSLAFSMMVIEIMAMAKLEAADSLRYIEAYADASIIYWVTSLIFERLFVYGEKRLGKFRYA